MASSSETAPVPLNPVKLTDNGGQGGQSLVRTGLRHLRQDKLTMLALIILITLALLSVLAPVISQNILHVDPDATDGYNHLQPIGTVGHILGTDNLGRDQLARLLFAGQVSLGIAFVSGILSIGIGLFLGVLAGYYGGALDDLINWTPTPGTAHQTAGAASSPLAGTSPPIRRLLPTVAPLAGPWPPCPPDH